ncbi:importin subunit beta-1-like [Tubulanus polymorphus]|uniref:importin subunit beta-1-like n=1 Tax=Tubulanus polymorphus TaxID=672921 RepID=UPI003DA42B20
MDVPLVTVLEKTVSPDNNELEGAQKYLEHAATTDLPGFLKDLSEILKNRTCSLVARMQAGLQLKNLIYSKDVSVREQYHQRWLQIPENIRAFVKANCLETLGTELGMRPSQAAQCVAYIACVELPHNMWPDVIQSLTKNVTKVASTDMMKESTLEAIGYICQDIEPRNILQTQANEILTAIVHGMKKEEQNDHVRLAATNALLNSLEFTRANFDKDTERNFIMQVVCEATQSAHTPVKVAALQCLVKIMSIYYHYMEAYMGPALFAISLEAMKSEIDDVALQGIEFWSNVCDEEVDLAIEASEATEQGRVPEKNSRFYAKGALQFLIPVLTSCLTKQEEFDDDDEWNPCKAAGVCLMLLASCCEDTIIEHIIPFITQNIINPDWRFRDAAVMSLGSILEGPDPSTLAPTIEEAMPQLIHLLNDQSIIVRDTSAWTIGRVCEIMPEVGINQSYLIPLLENLVIGLEAVPRVAANVCWAFSSLAEAAYEAAEVHDDEVEPRTYCLSPYFDQIVLKLLVTTDRTDGNTHNLRNAAYEALMEMIKNSPTDCYNTVQATTMTILLRLEKVLHMESAIQSNSDRVQFFDLQSLLCATLQSVLRKVKPEHAPELSDQIMNALLQMLNNCIGKCGGVQEDILLAVSTLVEVLGGNFLKYMETFKNFLMMGLKNFSEYAVCVAAVGLIGDLCRALGKLIHPYCDEIVLILLQILSNAGVHRSVKPQVLSVFGDIALAIGNEFQKYLVVVLQTLQQASQAEVENLEDPDMVDYLNELREGCLEAYTGIVQGLKGDGEQVNPEVAMIQGNVPHIISFLEVIAHDPYKSDAILAASCGLIGDLCSAFGVSLLPLLDKQPIHDLLTQARRSKTTKTKTIGTWATKSLRNMNKTQSS